MKKKGFETKIAQVSNGLVVKVGCTLLVAEADDLPALKEYYKGHVPKGFKELFKNTPTHDVPHVLPEEGTLVAEAKDMVDTTPSFLRDQKSDMSVWAARNGWIVNIKNVYYIAKTVEHVGDLMLSHLGLFTNERDSNG